MAPDPTAAHDTARADTARADAEGLDVTGRLEGRRSGIQARLEALQADLAAMIDASRTDNADDEHDPEGSTIAFERAQLSALRAAAEHDLADIELALLAYAQARYGICQVCGEQIAAARLELRPASSTCVRCAGFKPARRGGQ